MKDLFKRFIFPIAALSTLYYFNYNSKESEPFKSLGLSKKNFLPEIVKNYYNVPKDTLSFDSFFKFDENIFGRFYLKKFGSYFYDINKDSIWDISETYDLPIHEGQRPLIYLIKSKDKKILVSDKKQDGINGNEKFFSCGDKKFNPYEKSL